MNALRCAMFAMVVSTAACHGATPWTAVAPDNRTVLEVKKHRGQLCVSLAGRRQGCHEQVALRWLAFDDAGQHVAYPAGRGSQWMMIHDGAPGAVWDEVGRPVLGAQAGRLAYAARRGDQWHVVLDGVPGPPFAAIRAGSIAFDATGARVAYQGVRGDTTVTVIDGVETGRWAAAGNVHFGAGGRRWAHSARIGARWHLVTDAGVGPPYDEIGELVPGSGEATTMYAARVHDGWHVKHDDRSDGPFAGVRGLALTADGDPVFVARTARGEGVVRAGRAMRWHDSVSHHVEAPDGGWGYIALDADTSSAWIDGRRFAAVGVPIDLAIGSAGRHAVTLLRDSVSIIVAAGREHTFDVVVPGTLQFVGPATWAALAGTRRTRELFVVVDGQRVGRRFDWEELTRRIGSGGGSDAIRRWVAAEAALNRPSNQRE